VRASLAHLLNPGAKLMRQLPLTVKIAGTALAMLLPLFWLLGGDLARTRDELAITRAQSAGVDAARRLTDLVALVQLHRGQTDMALSGSSAALGQRAATRRSLDEAVRALDATVQAQAALGLESRWTPVRDGIGVLTQDRLPAERKAAFQAHADVVASLQSMLQFAGERSNLLLDSHPESRLLIALVVERFVPWAEQMAMMHSAGAGLLAGDNVDRAAVGRVLQQRDALLAHGAALKESVDALGRVRQPASAAWQQALAAADRFAGQVTTVFGGAAVSGDAQPWLSGGSTALAHALQARTQALDELQALLKARADGLARHNALALALGATGIALLLYLTACFYVATIPSLRAVSHGLERLSRGDLACVVEVHGRDEFAQMGQQLERMAASLSSIVAAVRNDASLVGTAGERVAGASRGLAERTEEQTASLRQTTVTVREISDTVARNAAAAHEADERMTTLRNAAESGNQAMSAAVQTMARIENSAARMAEIVTTIDAIAFQTNLLALNAAVEAARAGTAGKGFAVVAGEVRQLARRAGDSAGEIRTLIGTSRDEAGEGARRVRAIQTEMAHVLDGVREVADSLRSIAQASMQQSTGVAQVTSAVANLEQITQGNAGAASVANTTAQGLLHRASSLSAAVSHMKLRQGTADEARALVEKAAALTRQKGWAAAQPELHAAGNSFSDRDLYVFAFDREGVYRAFSSNTAKIGQPLSSVAGLDAGKLVADAWRVVDEQRNGWVDYDIVNPTTGAVTSKTSFVIGVSDQLLLGCGIYRNVLAVPAAPAQQAAAVAATDTRPARQLAAA
jgi:methyl-accepting chemotaxis protein